MSNIVKFRPPQGETAAGGPQPLAPPMLAVPAPAAYPLYLRLRERGCDHWKACDALAKVVVKHPDRFPEWAYDDDNHPLPTPAIIQTVRAYAGEFSWDRLFRTLSRKLTLFDEDIYKARYLEAKATYEATVAIGAAYLDAPPHDDDSRKLYLSSLAAKEQAWAAYQDADALYRKEQLEQPDPKRIEQIYGHLIAQYDGLGPQYEIMCRSLAEQREWLERQQRSGRSLPSEEVLAISKSMQAWIKQIQQYTEATKSESIRKETQEYIAIVMKILEDVIAPQAPRAWQAGVHELNRRISAARAKKQGFT